MSAARQSLRASKALSAGLVLLVAAAFRLTLLGLGLLFLVHAWRTGKKCQRRAGWRELLAGVLFGAAIASKWSAIFVIVPAILVWIVLTWRRGSPAQIRHRAAVGGALVLAP